MIFLHTVGSKEPQTGGAERFFTLKTECPDFSVAKGTNEHVIFNYFVRLPVLEPISGFHYFF